MFVRFFVCVCVRFVRLFDCSFVCFFVCVGGAPGGGALPKTTKTTKTNKNNQNHQNHQTLLILMGLKGHGDGDHRKWRQRRRRCRQRHRRARVPSGQWVACGNRAVGDVMEIKRKWQGANTINKNYQKQPKPPKLPNTTRTWWKSKEMVRDTLGEPWWI